jgi:hypothetical protein
MLKKPTVPRGETPCNKCALQATWQQQLELGLLINGVDISSARGAVDSYGHQQL